MMIGKAKILFKSVGCTVCGGEVGSEPELAEQIRILIGNRRAYLPLYRCERHARNRGAQRGQTQ